MLVTAAAYGTGNGNFEDLMLVSGVGLLPAWLIWTGRVRRGYDPSVQETGS